MTVYLQEFATNGRVGIWVTKAKGEGNHKPRDEGGGRTNARRTCASHYLTGWRNIVDVDVHGEIDNSERDQKTENVNCRVYN